MSETISFIVHLPGKPEHREELESKLLDVLERMTEEPDFVDTGPAVSSSLRGRVAEVAVARTHDRVSRSVAHLRQEQEAGQLPGRRGSLNNPSRVE